MFLARGRQGDAEGRLECRGLRPGHHCAQRDVGVGGADREFVEAVGERAELRMDQRGELGGRVGGVEAHARREGQRAGAVEAG